MVKELLDRHMKAFDGEIKAFRKKKKNFQGLGRFIFFGGKDTGVIKFSAKDGRKGISFILTNPLDKTVTVTHVGEYPEEVNELVINHFQKLIDKKISQGFSPKIKYQETIDERLPSHLFEIMVMHNRGCDASNIANHLLNIQLIKRKEKKSMEKIVYQHMKELGLIKPGPPHELTGLLEEFSNAFKGEQKQFESKRLKIKLGDYAGTYNYTGLYNGGHIVYSSLDNSVRGCFYFHPKMQENSVHAVFSGEFPQNVKEAIQDTVHDLLGETRLEHKIYTNPTANNDLAMKLETIQLNPDMKINELMKKINLGLKDTSKLKQDVFGEKFDEETPPVILDHVLNRFADSFKGKDFPFRRTLKFWDPVLRKYSVDFYGVKNGGFVALRPVQWIGRKAKKPTALIYFESEKDNKHVYVKGDFPKQLGTPIITKIFDVLKNKGFSPQVKPVTQGATVGSLKRRYEVRKLLHFKEAVTPEDIQEVASLAGLSSTTIRRHFNTSKPVPVPQEEIDLAEALEYTPPAAAKDTEDFISKIAGVVSRAEAKAEEDAETDKEVFRFLTMKHVSVSSIISEKLGLSANRVLTSLKRLEENGEVLPVKTSDLKPVTVAEMTDKAKETLLSDFNGIEKNDRIDFKGSPAGFFIPNNKKTRGFIESIKKRKLSKEADLLKRIKEQGVLVLRELEKEGYSKKAIRELRSKLLSENKLIELNIRDLPLGKKKYPESIQKSFADQDLVFFRSKPCHPTRNQGVLLVPVERKNDEWVRLALKKRDARYLLRKNK